MPKPMDDRELYILALETQAQLERGMLCTVRENLAKITEGLRMKHMKATIQTPTKSQFADRDQWEGR